MSLIKRYWIGCDGCGKPARRGEQRTTQKARAEARKQGWKRTPGSATSGKDWCPDCAPESAL